jgi:hypothetical protein
MPKGPAPSSGREASARWARSLLSEGNFVVLDSETTGLGNPVDFVEVGVVSCRGETLFGSLIKPSCPIEPGATRVHGHTTESLMGQRRFHELYPDLLEALWAKRVVVYNAPYDRRVWDAAVVRLGARAALAGELAPWECASAPSRPTRARGPRGAVTRARSWWAATTRRSGTRGRRCA